MSTPDVAEAETLPGTPRLLWGIRASFLRYLNHSGPYRITGARPDDSEQFAFLQTGATENGVQFVGLIEIVAHGGLLRLKLQDPTMHTNESGAGSVTFVVDDRGTRMPVLHTRLSSPSTWATFLTADGTRVFNDVYPEGLPMADLHLRQ